MTTPPLNPNLPMVDEEGRPTPFFMRWWQNQIDTNTGITVLDSQEAVSGVLDLLGTELQGQVLYRGVNFWELLDPANDDDVFVSNGASADPQWKSVSNLLDDAVSNTQGSILYRSSGGWNALGPGTAEYVLTTKGAAADPVWQEAAGSEFVLIEDKDTSADNQDEYTFDVTGFDEVMIVFEGLDKSASASWHIDLQLSDDGGSTFFDTSGDYHVARNANYSTTPTFIQTGGNSSFVKDGYITFRGLSNASVTPTFIGHVGEESSNTFDTVQGKTTFDETIDAIKVYQDSSTIDFDTGNIRVYGK